MCLQKRLFIINSLQIRVAYINFSDATFSQREFSFLAKSTPWVPLCCSLCHSIAHYLFFNRAIFLRGNVSLSLRQLILSLFKSSCSYPYFLGHDLLKSFIVTLVDGRFWSYIVLILWFFFHFWKPQSPIFVAYFSRIYTSFITIHYINCLHPTIFIDEFSQSTLF